jgi:hypothetical protein
METLQFKTCPKCKFHKEVTKFRKQKSRKDGLQVYCKECQNYHSNFKAKSNPLYKLRRDIVKNIRLALLYNKSGVIRENSKLRQILGCTLQEFKNHLESQFEPWMTWDNRGLYNGQLNYGWDVDHIIPKATAKTQEELIKLNHYTNLRPRCSYLNRVIDRRIKS